MTNAALRGKPYAGNPHVRFDEGEVAPAATPRRGSLLYKKLMAMLVVAVLAAGAFAKEATLVHERGLPREGAMLDWTPFALTIAGPVGLPCGSWNIKGLQIGIWNDVHEFSGLQIGGINVADRAYGIQIGFINVIAGDDIPFLPVLNWSF